MVEWDGLENRCTGNRTVGSNPTLSASPIRYVFEKLPFLDWGAEAKGQRCPAKNLVLWHLNELFARAIEADRHGRDLGSATMRLPQVQRDEAIIS